MRYLTDPVEIRAFRKKQTKKIARMLVQKAQRAFLEFTVCMCGITLWAVCFVLLMACVIFVLENCTVNW